MQKSVTDGERAKERAQRTRLPALVVTVLLALAAAVLSNPDTLPRAEAGPPLTVENPSFETGDLSGWTVLEGEAFNDDGVTDAEDWGWGCCFDRVGDYHFWGFAAGGDGLTGRMRSSTFTLGGVGQISFLLGGGNDIDNLYVALIRESDGAELRRATNTRFDDTERMHQVVWDVSDQLGEEMYLLVVDEATGGWGHLNLDHVQTYHETPVIDVVPPVIRNASFETGDLTGWTVVSGDAFGPDQVTNEPLEGMDGDYHLWGAHGVPDEATGELRSSRVELRGTGVVEFLIGGDDDEDLFVSAVRAEDDVELARAHGPGHDAYTTVSWDLSDHLGEQLYLRVVDESATGHLNLDGVRTLETAPMHWPFDETSGASADDIVSGVTDHIDYVFNDARYKPDSDPTRRPGVHGNALLFDGWSTWMSRPAAEAFIPGTKLAIEAWVAPRSYEWRGRAQATAIVSQHDREQNAGYLLGIHEFGRLVFEVGDGVGWHTLRAPEGTELPTGQWTHVVATYDGDAGSMELYLDGEPAASTSVPAGGYVLASTADLQVGRNNHAASIGAFRTSTWGGLIDELKVGADIPAPGQIQAAYQAGLGDNGTLPDADVAPDRARYDGDRYRPQYHFVPPDHWMNEPHAPIYYNGQYHLFYQYNPQGPYWGQIHWGHAVSDDLVHWRDVEPALAPAKDSPAPDGVWSGSATYDADGNPVLFFTAGDDSDTPNQRTGLALPTSLEGDLVEWEMHPEPVTVQEPDLHADEGEVWFGQFRDPFVWQETDDDGTITWYQLVTSGIKDPDTGASVGGTALLYTSKNMIDWTYEGPLLVGDFETYPATGEVWELPIFLPLGTDDEGNEKHILLVNPWFEGFSEHAVKYIWYWVGTWDAEARQFVPDDETPQLLDYGEHFTGPAGMVTPDGRPVLFSITQDRRPNQEHFDAGWAHMVGMPVELRLRDDGSVGVAPLAEFEALRTEQVVDARNIDRESANALLDEAHADMTDMLEVEVELKTKDATHVGLELRRSGDGRERTTFWIDKATDTFSVDRTFSSLDADPRKGEQGGELNIPPNGKVTLRAFVDRSTIETFAGDHLITTRVYPALPDSTGVRLVADGQVKVSSLKVWNLGSIHGDVVPSHFDPRDLDGTEPLPNHDFSTCDLTGWTVVEGEAFSDDHVTDAEDWGWGGTFLQAHPWGSDNRCHLWGFNEAAGGDGLTGTLRSAEFELGGDGHIDFLIGGGKDLDRLYIALVRSGTGEIVRRETGTDWPAYARRRWDASEHIGERLHIEIVDHATGGFGHINIDDVNVPVAVGSLEY
jgi:fructan beta-fructosidase